ncbi:MAG TPA: adenylate/guanylate cyclase domain-containing protein [Gemmatimonadota bacterium]|jgi:adenylate cyclase|nr:adenylate/guanylate cyclase domain-containing protein [Gemmatimonadota bacterium]
MAFAKRCPGGAEIELSMLFVDVRGSTGLAEKMSPTDFGRLMNRFYKAATDVLIDSNAVIDKLVGDQVIGLYLPLFTGPNHARPAIVAARRLLEVAGHGTDDGPWLQIGVGVHSGTAFVGTVSGADDTVADITALGDNMNIGARLASMARPGEVLVSEASLRFGDLDLRTLELRRLDLKGKSEPIDVRVIRTAASMPS